MEVLTSAPPRSTAQEPHRDTAAPADAPRHGHSQSPVNTELAYGQQISAFARHFDCSPEALGTEQIRACQVHLLEQRKLAAGSLSVVAAALRFLYKITLRRAWNDGDIPMPERR